MQEIDFSGLLCLQQANDLLQSGTLAYTCLATQTLFCISNTQFCWKQDKTNKQRRPANSPDFNPQENLQRIIDEVHTVICPKNYIVWEK